MPLALHHLGVAVKDLEAAAAVYTARYGYRKSGGPVHDPVQTAHVLFLELAGQAFCLELVAPDGPQSKLSNAVKKGGGLNHLCYLTEDIEQSCATLRQDGMYLLQEPTPAAAFAGRRIAWLMGLDGIPVELLEKEC